MTGKIKKTRKINRKVVIVKKEKKNVTGCRDKYGNKNWLAWDCASCQDNNECAMCADLNASFCDNCDGYEWNEKGKEDEWTCDDCHEIELAMAYVLSAKA